MSEHTTFCPTCQDEALISTAGLCVWCDTPLERTPAPKKRGGGKPKGKYRKMTEAQIRAAHVLYWQRRMSLRQVARLLYEQFGFASEKACANSLNKYFIELEMPRRDRLEEAVRMSTKHGNAPKRRTAAEERAYRRWLQGRRGWRSQQGPGQERCVATLTGCRGGKGKRCSRPSMVDSDYCANHDPARRELQAAKLAEVRALQPKREMVPLEPFARWVEERVAVAGSQKAYARLVGYDNTTISGYVKRERCGSDGRRYPITEIGRETVERWLERDGTTSFDHLYALDLQVAAGRDFIGMELNPEYVELGRRRLIDEHGLIASAGEVA